jgi:hypothetical protein
LWSDLVWLAVVGIGGLVLQGRLERPWQQKTLPEPARLQPRSCVISDVMTR